MELEEVGYTIPKAVYFLGIKKVNPIARSAKITVASSIFFFCVYKLLSSIILV